MSFDRLGVVFLPNMELMDGRLGDVFRVWSVQFKTIFRESLDVVIWKIAINENYSWELKDV